MDHLRVFCNHLFGATSPSSGAAARSCSASSMPCPMAPASSTQTPGPGLFPTVGNRVHDLLSSGFHLESKLILTSFADQVSIKSHFSNKSEAMICQILASVKLQNVKVVLESTTENELSMTMRTEGLGTPRFYTLCTMHLTDLNAGKAEIQYLHDYAGISAGITLKRSPVMNVSCLFGTKKFVAGADLGYDTPSRSFNKYNFAMGLSVDGLFSSLLLSDKCDNLTAGYYHLIKKEDKLAVGAEMKYNFSSKTNTTSIGFQQFLDSQTFVKLRFSNDGVASAFIQHEIMPKSFVTISGDIDTVTMKCPKIGLGLILNV